jgi:hypothetical protein
MQESKFQRPQKKTSHHEAFRDLSRRGLYVALRSHRPHQNETPVRHASFSVQNEAVVGTAIRSMCLSGIWKRPAFLASTTRRRNLTASRRRGYDLAGGGLVARRAACSPKNWPKSRLRTRNRETDYVKIDCVGLKNLVNLRPIVQYVERPDRYRVGPAAGNRHQQSASAPKAFNQKRGPTGTESAGLLQGENRWITLWKCAGCPCASVASGHSPT